MNKLFEYFNNLNENNKFSQAFLIGNVCFDDIKDELYKIFKKFIFKNENTNIILNSNLYLLTNTEKEISKDDIKGLINNISTTSQFDGKKIFIIENCERLSSYVYNSLLKTIEEPGENVYAFLLSKNIDAVKDTLASRCQKIFISSEKTESIDENYIQISNKILEYIENDSIKTIYKYSKIYEDIENKNDFKKIVNIIFKKYFNELNNLIKNNKIDDEIIKNNDIISLTKKILIVNKYINVLDKNVNKNLSIDRFLIEMWRCNI